MQLFGGMTGARAVVALPLALRKRLVDRFVSGSTMRTDECVVNAARTSPFYRSLYSNQIPAFERAPIVTADMLADAPPEVLLAEGQRDRPVVGLRSEAGAPGYFTVNELLAIGAGALLHPDAGKLLAALREQGYALNALPYSLSLLGPMAERLVRYLGGCGLQGYGVDDDRVQEILIRERPAVVFAERDALVQWIEALEPGAANAVVRSLQWWLRTDCAGPMPAQRVQELEIRYRLRLVEVLTDGYSFLLLSCGCGQFHPGANLVMETVDETGTPCPGPGRLVVTDLARRAMPLVRYDTGLVGMVRSDGCPHLGQTRSVTVAS